MYRNFSPRSLGLTGRQSELIELALTHGYRGMDIAVDDFCRQADQRGFEYADRFLLSARLKITGGDLPVDWTADEQPFLAQLEQLQRWTDILVRIGVDTLYAIIPATSPTRPYHENFELHRTRFLKISDQLRSSNIMLALGLSTPVAGHDESVSPFITRADALLTLIRTIGAPNVGLLLDSWNWHVGHGTVDALRELPIEQIAAVRLAGLSSATELRQVTDRDRIVPGLDDQVPNRAIITLVQERGYERSVSVLPHPAQLRGMTRDQIAKMGIETIKWLQTSAPDSTAADSGAAQQEAPAPAATERVRRAPARV
jgi:sugar phosphate isomerase/epimerase